MGAKMQLIKSVFIVLIINVLIIHAASTQSFIDHQSKIKGITMVSPPKPFPTNPIPNLQLTHANWIAITPFGFSKSQDVNIHFNQKTDWWGLQNEGIEKTIALAKKDGLQIMIKPQIYIENDWVGDLNFLTEEEWHEWEQNYTRFILNYVSIAQENQVELVCIGTELRNSVMIRKAYWLELIQNIRAIYDGKLVYASNWDAYHEVPIWDAVDYIGVSAYFPLTKSKTPNQRELLRKWRPAKRKLKALSTAYGKQILFTEFGYLSVDGCAYKAWELEEQIEQLTQNQQAQANAIDALFMTFWNEDFWAGGFLWKWFPNMEGHEGYPDLDYTPQGKMAETIIRRWYGRKGFKNQIE